MQIFINKKNLIIVALIFLFPFNAIAQQSQKKTDL